MSTTTSLSNFEKKLTGYLNQVEDNHSVVFVTRDNHQPAAVVSAKQLDALLTMAQADVHSLEYAIARDQLVEMGVLPDDPIIESMQDFWE